MHFLKFVKALGLSGGGGEMAMAVAASARLAFFLRCTTDVVPWSLCSDSLLSSRPQPKGSDGDVTPRKDTREDLGLSPFTFVHHVVLQGGFKKLVRYIPERPGWEPACVVDYGASVVTSVVTGSNPVGGYSAGELVQEQGPTGLV